MNRLLANSRGSHFVNLYNSKKVSRAELGLNVGQFSAGAFRKEFLIRFLSEVFWGYQMQNPGISGNGHLDGLPRRRIFDFGNGA